MLTLFLQLMTLSFSAAAEVPQPPGGLDFRVDANLTYFSSQTNYGAGGGSREDLRNGGYFTDIIGRLQYTQDLNRSQRVYGGFTFSQTESSDGTNTRTNNGFNEILAGGQMWFPMGSYNLVAAGDFVYPLYRVSRDGDDVPLGEGAMKIRGGGWFIYPMGKLQGFLNLGYEYRDEGRSHAIPYSAGAFYKLTRALWVQGEYRGYEKLFDNADTENRASRDLFLQRVSGGSYRYFALNPAMSEVAVSAGYTFGTITVYGDAAYMVNGANVADGMTFMAGLAYVPGGRITDRGEPDDEEVFNPHRRPRRTEPIEEHLPPDDDGFMAEPDPRVPPPDSAPPEEAPLRDEPAMKPAESGGGEVQLQMRKAPPKAKPAQKPKPKPKPKPKSKREKIDKMLQNTEKTLQDL